MTSTPAANIVQPDQIKINIPPTKSSFSVTVFKVAVWFLVIYLISQLAFVYVNHMPTFSWWQKGDPGKKFTNILSIWGLMMWMNGSYLLYNILMLFYPGTTRLTDAQIEFIVGKLFPFQTWTDDKNVHHGILTPYQLCKTILLTTKDPQPDPLFVAWMTKHAKTRTEASIEDQDPALALSFSGPNSVTVNNQTLYDFTPIKLKNETWGVYPLAVNRTDWMGCIQAWANGGLEALAAGAPKVFYWSKNNDIYTLTTAQGVDPKTDKWFDIDSQSDNVFARYKILYDNPLIISFVNGAFNFPNMGMKPDAVALQNLIWAESGLAGGWVGFIKGLGSDASSDDIHNILYTSVKFPPDKADTTPACGTNKFVSAIPGAVATGAGIAVMGPSLAAIEIFGGPIGWFGALVVLGALTASVYLSNAFLSNPC